MSDFGMPRGQHYVFAHRIIPQVFFGDPAAFMGYLLRDGDQFLRFYWDRIGERVENPHDLVDPGGLHGEIRKLDNHVQVALIALPEPQFATEAYFIAAAYHPELDGKILARYYTLEYGVSFLDNAPYTVLGGWVAGGHINMGDGPPPEIEGFYEVIRAKLVDEASPRPPA
jgi:hypothetical protein